MCDALHDSQNPKWSFEPPQIPRPAPLPVKLKTPVEQQFVNDEAMKKFFPVVAALLDAASAWGNPSVRRSLRNVLTNAVCPNLRLSFPVRVDAIYLYTVVPRGEAVVNLKTIERAIASSVSSTMETCDDVGRPTHIVELSEERQHEVIDYGAWKRFATL